MSDAKSDKGGEEGGGGSNLLVDAIFWILFVVVLFSVLKGVLEGLNISFDLFPSPSDIFAVIFGPIQVLSVFFSLLFLIGIIYYNVKLGDLMHSGHGHGGGHGGHDAHTNTHAASHVVARHEAPVHAPDRRWVSVQSRLTTSSEADWRLAIIEADIILDDMLTRMGYQGEGIGEKLKAVDRKDFKTLDLAWDAHKIRNRIAHDGPTFHLSHDEAKRVIGEFEKVFQEFYFI